MGLLFSVAVESARRGKKSAQPSQAEPLPRSRLRLTERLAQHGR
jgi:hypothetical protein